MGMAVGGKKGGITAEINVTPLIDVVLVLLIIFMVITPMLQSGRAVQLPKGVDPAKKPDTDTDIIVSIQWNDANQHSLYYASDADPISREQLVQQLTELHDRDASSPLYIKADKRLRYGVVRDTMLACESAGFRSIALVAEAPQ